MRKIAILAAASLMMTGSAAFAAMNADVFYNKAAALEKKGAAALLSSDLKPVMNEMKAAGKALKAENEAAKKRGKPLFCPPKKAGMSSTQALAELRALGTAKRKSMNVKQAFRAIMVKKYPCK